jgi:hypothetical protein
LAVQVHHPRVAARNPISERAPFDTRDPRYFNAQPRVKVPPLFADHFWCRTCDLRSSMKVYVSHGHNSLSFDGDDSLSASDLGKTSFKLPRGRHESWRR